MTSKEALLKLIFKDDDNTNFDKCMMVIKQDLDRLEELEQENEDLKEELELLKKKYYELKEQLSSGNL